MHCHRIKAGGSEWSHRCVRRSQIARPELAAARADAAVGRKVTTAMRTRRMPERVPEDGARTGDSGRDGVGLGEENLAWCQIAVARQLGKVSR
jgi:hypothetical protein